MMLERIRREHGYMVRLLAILKRKLQQLSDDKPINYSLVKEIVDYLSVHSEKVHHPKEDVIYHYFIEHYGPQQDIINLEEQHIELSKDTHEFLDIVEMILKDAVVPKSLFIEKLEQFIIAQKQHLDMEEHEVLPLINRAFTTEDWQNVEGQWDVAEDDPVFGDTIADQYKQLAERVKQSELECI